MRRRVLFIIVLVGAACGVEPLPPLVRLEFRPRLLCEGQPEQVITFSAEARQPFAGTVAPTFAWSFLPAAEQLVSGRLDTDVLQVTFAARRPVEVSLEVSAEGQTARRRAVLPLSRASLPSCTSDRECFEGEACVSIDGVNGCTPDATCLDDSYCGCWRCARIDDGRQRCVPAN